MIQFYNSIIDQCIVHYVGNKSIDEEVKLSKSIVSESGEINLVLTNYFLKSFLQKEDFYHFYHISDISLNEVFSYISSIFSTAENFKKESINLAKHLYEQSTHPKIKGGEFYVVYFKDCIVDGDTVDAVGLFKSENKDTFLKVYTKGDGFEIESQKGININKLDKGCLIFNKEKENGYVVAVVDNTNKGAEAKYWTDDFLHVKPRNDAYNQTKDILSMAKNFVLHELPQHFEVSKVDQVDLLNKSVEYFKKNESFNMNGFAHEVIEQKDLIEKFVQYKSDYEHAMEMSLVENFEISEAAVKKQAKSIKSVIKLDKNFHIYVHGSQNLIEQGVEEDGRKYYKIYYREES